MAIYPSAAWMPISNNVGGSRLTTRAVVLHVAASEAQSLYGWFNNPAALASSHFYVTYTGHVEQYVDTGSIAWTQRAGNSSCIGIETQGLGTGGWTSQQMAALGKLLAWLGHLYDLPMVDMRNSNPSSVGIGLHRYGCDPWRVPTGEVWGPQGKICPGDGRIAQFPGLLASAQAMTEVNRQWRTDDMAIIYRATGERTPYGILGANGGWVELATKAEYDNFRRAGVPEIWVESWTLKSLIADSRSH